MASEVSSLVAIFVVKSGVAVRVHEYLASKGDQTLLVSAPAGKVLFVGEVRTLSDDSIAEALSSLESSFS